MNFAYIENGALVQFFTELPFTFKDVPRVRSLTAMEQAALGLLPVMDVTPAFDPALRRLANTWPTAVVLADRVEITRPTEAIPSAELNERASRRALQDDPRAIELRDQLRTATPAAINAYVDAQVTDLASARTMIKRILLVFAVLCR